MIKVKKTDFIYATPDYISMAGVIYFLFDILVFRSETVRFPRLKKMGNSYKNIEEGSLI